MKYELEITSKAIPMAEDLIKYLKQLGVPNDNIVCLNVTADGYVRMAIHNMDDSERVEVMRSNSNGMYTSEHYKNGGYQE